MSLHALLAEITRSAEAEEDRIRREASTREGEILQACEVAIASRRASELTRITDAGNRAVARDTAAAEQASRLAVLEARSRLMTTVFARAAAELERADASRYRDAIPWLVKATLPYLEGRTAVLRCRPDVAPAVQAACDGASTIAVECAPDIGAGLLGETRDGTLMVDNRLATLLDRRRDDLGIELARRLEDL